MQNKNNKIAKWFFYTFLAGLIPFFARLFVYFSNQPLPGDFLLNGGDFAALGIVMNITIINEFGNVLLGDDSIKTWFIGSSSIFLILYGMIIFCILDKSLSSNPQPAATVLYISLGLCFISIIMGFVSNYIIVNIENNSINIRDVRENG